MSAKGNSERRSAATIGGQWKCWAIFAVAFLGILLGTSTGLRAQGVRYDNILLGPRGKPVASATVAVCSAGAATSTAPCSPLATVYSDEALTQPTANPFQTDSLGNYGFWAAPGHYVVQVYGTGVTPRVMNVFLPCDPSNCSMSNASFSSITAGTLNLTGSLTVNGRAVATEPKADDAVMYVSPNGSDSSSGLSWGTAKKTLYGAISALTSGATIYVAAGSSCGGPVSGQGLWLYGGGISSPGTGWLNVAGKPLDIIGVGTTTWAAASPIPQVQLNCGSATEPALEIHANNLPLKFENLDFAGSMGAYLQNATSIVFDGDSFVVDDSNTTNGPAVLIGSASFELYFRHCVFYANQNSGVTRNGADSTEAFVVNPGTSSPNSDLIYVTQSVGQYGSIKFYTNGTTSWTNGLMVNGFLTENQQDGKGAVWFPANTTGAISGTGSARLNSVGVADSVVNPTPAVQVDGYLGTSQIIASDITGYGKNAMGPMTVLSSYAANGQNLTQLPVTQGQLGPFSGRSYDLTDAARRLFPPSVLPDGLTNLASYFPSQWENDGGNPAATAAPDGTNNAASVTGGVRFYNTSISISNGDYIIGGVWARDASGTGYPGGAPIQVDMAGCTTAPTLTGLIPTSMNSSGYIGGNWTGNPSEWEFWPFVYKLGGLTGSESCNLQFFAYGQASNTMDLFAPVLFHVSTGTISDSEAALIGLNLGSYPKGLSAATEATLPGHPFAFGGSGDNYFATLDHAALTVNRTYDFPDASGTIALSGAGGISAGTITLSSGSGSHTFATPYTTAPVCTASDTSSAAAVKVTSSATAVSISGTGSDVVAWVCSPAAN